MTAATVGRTVNGASVSKVVILGAGLAVVSALALAAGPLGYRFGAFSLRTIFLQVLPWGAYAGGAAAVVSLIGLILTLMKPPAARQGLALAVVSLLAGTALFGMPARFRYGPRKPPIHDITTDTTEPPQYVAVAPLRAKAPNTMVYGGEKIATQQRAAYPEIQPLVLAVPPAQAFDRALAAVRAMGWTLVAAEPADGRIEATDTTLWFRFKDDVVVRIRPVDGGSRVDVRSLSRVGGGDLGTNAKRVRAYLEKLKAS